MTICFLCFPPAAKENVSGGLWSWQGLAGALFPVEAEPTQQHLGSWGCFTNLAWPLLAEAMQQPRREGPRYAPAEHLLVVWAVSQQGAL